MNSTRGFEEQRLLHRTFSANSSEQDVDYDGDTSEYELDCSEDGRGAWHVPLARLPTWTYSWTSRKGRRTGRARSPLARFMLPAVRRRRSIPLCAAQALVLFSYIVVVLVLLAGLFAPSYSDPPKQYSTLRRTVESGDAKGRGNLHNEKIFIAAAVYDHQGELLSGAWGAQLMELIEILGPDNVFLSIYENGADEQAQLALHEFSEVVSCNHSIVHEHLDLALLPHVRTPSGASRLKRIAFLAEVRNRALRPLDDPRSPAYSTRFDKLLYLNDIFFDPIDAANLLLSTNVDSETGKTDYRAACAVDFINHFKFYDTFATRDTEGYEIGVPFYPWFTASGNATSRKDVLAQKDAVRVKSCWSGMVAFEAKWLQPRMHLNQNEIYTNTTEASALRFRAEADTYWDASECCLIHADLAERVSALGLDEGIYMNPYIRVAYSPSVLHWLAFTRRFERLYPWVHRVVNRIASRPRFNPRRTQQTGEVVVDKVWVWDVKSQHKMPKGKERGVGPSSAKSSDKLDGHFEPVVRVATPGQFCGVRNLFYINEHPKAGEKHWGEDAP